MLLKMTNILQKEKRILASALFFLAVIAWTKMRPLGIGSADMRWGLQKRLLPASAPPSAATETPLNLGHLQPTGETMPDGSEVWGYPEGSELEGVLEVHVRDGRVIREVLRPSARRSGSQMAGVLR